MKRRISRKDSLVGFERDADSCRVAVVGAPAVGKTAITVRLITKRFIGEYSPTLEQEYSCPLDVDGAQVQLEILDTAGEVSQTTRDFYLQWADCMILVYSISDHSSFVHAERMLSSLSSRMRGKTLPVGAVIGNKCDLCHERQVSRETGQSLADKHGWSFQELSAADASMLGSIINIFSDCARLLQRRRKIIRKSSLPASFKLKNAIQRVLMGNKNKMETLGDES